MSHDLSALRRASKTLIRYPRFQALHNKIVESHEMSKLLGTPQCLAIEGQAGVGKTELIKTYARNFPRKIVGDKTRIPVLLVTAPKPVTIKMMSTTMLRSLGDPNAAKGDQESKNMRLKNYIGKDCETELVIIDEFQHLLQSGTDKVLAKVTDWLKYLIKETGTPFLVVGMEGKTELILRSNPQLDRLFDDVELLKPFQFDINKPGTVKEFATTINQLSKVIGRELPWRSKEDSDFAYRMHYATNGIFAYIEKLMYRAVVIATENKSDKIEMKFLEDAFEQKVKRKLRKEHNPFEEKWKAGFKPPRSQP